MTPIAEQLKLCISGGAPMPVEVMRAFEATFGVRILEGYGLSETSPVASFNHSERPSQTRHGRPADLRLSMMCVDENDEPRAGRASAARSSSAATIS